MPLPYPVLLADIGGTYACFAVLSAPAARPAPVWKVPTASFRNPLDAQQAYLDDPGWASASANPATSASPASTSCSRTGKTWSSPRGYGAMPSITSPAVSLLASPEAKGAKAKRRAAYRRSVYCADQFVVGRRKTVADTARPLA